MKEIDVIKIEVLSSGEMIVQPDASDNSILVRATEDEVNNIQTYVNVNDVPPGRD